MKKKSIKETNKIQHSKSKNKRKKDIVSDILDTQQYTISEFALRNSQSNRLSVVMGEESQTLLTKQKGSPQSTLKQFSKIFNNSMDASVNSINHQSELSTFHCIYCNLRFTSKMGLQTHCLTDEHQAIIISDEGRDWKFRPPPRGVLANEYSLCLSWSEMNVCRFGSQCIQAHSNDELSEWKERFEYRSMKLERAKEKELHGATYADKLLEKLSNAQNLDALLSDKVDGVVHSVNSDVNLCISQKPSKHTWTVTVHCPYQIHAIALLHDSHRNHFSLSSITMINSQKHIHKAYKLNEIQEWVNPDLVMLGGEQIKMEYKIEICFRTEIYGTFRQAAVIDFGFEPVFIQKFCVDIVPLDEFKELESARTTVITRSERWCEENTNIVFFEPVEKSNEDLNNDKLLEMYPPPTNKNVILNQTSLEKHPTKNNYKSRMHDLLNYEEMAQFDLISHFNIKSYLHLTKSYLLMPYSVSIANYALAGELYARLDLSSEISEDSAHGRLILNNCYSVLITKADINDSKGSNTLRERRAYEGLIEAKTKKEIYIRLSQQTVNDLELVADVDVALDIQFQLNRLPLCETHLAIDRLSSLDLLFPDVISEPIIPWSPSMQWHEPADFKLNLKQKEALVAITASPQIKLPPILIIGPFGTGKTYTLGQAVKQVISQPDTRILICTHSNSAADIYIRDYLHPHYEAGYLESKPLRIYYPKRRVATVQAVIQKYCILETKFGDQKFLLPTKQQLLDHRIIVTTINTSICLAHIGIKKGYFTHILIDEAAQVMECSTLIPLSLADSSTRVVLAGDYMQLSTEIFSTVCKERNLHLSLLERLYDLYPSDYPCRIMLVENYRSHPAIIKYTSNFFYEGRLMPRGKIPAHPRYHPLTFFTARGEDVQDASSTAYYNNSEVLEVCERVMEIYKTWPVKLWGRPKEESIGVVTPYLDQVMRIRAELRKKKLYKVSVERVLNVQGKEFRVIILSTVRTRHTCTGRDASLDYGFLSNAKLLTTAITRAQSLVAVVGDPVSLCSLGKCSKLWEEFLHQCSEAGSLHGITWTYLRSQLDGIELRKIYGLNPLAQEFIPRYLLLSAVPHPMALLPPVPSMPCISYARPFAYSTPSVFPQLPLQYPTTNYFPPSVLAPTIANTKSVDPVKTVTYNHPPYQPVANVYPNRTIVPFGAAAAAAATIGHFPSLASPHFYASPTTNTTIHPAYVQAPSLNVYMAGALPYQPKFGVFPSLVSARPSEPQARPPPGFNGTINNSLLESERLKILYQQNLTQNNPPSIQRSPQENRSSTPDKNIQFLNNVHFPRGPSSTSNWNDMKQSKVESQTNSDLHSSLGSTPEENALKNHSETFMGEKFAEEISRLLNDQSPAKPKLGVHSLSSTFSNTGNNEVEAISMKQHSIYHQENDLGFNHFPTSATAAIRNQALKSFLTVQEVEKSLHSFPENLKTNGPSHNLGNSLLMESQENSPCSTSDQSSFSQCSSNFPREQNYLLTESLKWTNLSNNVSHQSFLNEPYPAISQLPPKTLSNISLLDMNSGGFRSSSSNIPLYLRKGNRNFQNTVSQPPKAESASANLGTSRGWDVNTVNNKCINSSVDKSPKEEYVSSLINREDRDRVNPFIHKPSLQDNANDAKTYAGVLRSTLDPNNDRL